MNLPTISIKSLYPLALAEGEGVGTAYEYFAKRLVLARWYQPAFETCRLLVAGLPEKYGSSLDFLLLAEELRLKPIIVDERADALVRLERSLVAAQGRQLLCKIQPELIHVADLTRLTEVNGRFDLALSSEVLQRLAPERRVAYGRALLDHAVTTAIFAPNADNPAHTNVSGLHGIHLATMKQMMLDTIVTDSHSSAAGYLDMPPFPPGMIRSDSQREQASNGRLEGLAMWGLGYYAAAERFLPTVMRRRQSHIVYALLKRRADR
jgi:hypothetical protein